MQDDHSSPQHSPPLVYLHDPERRSAPTQSFYRGLCHAVDVCVSPEGLSGSVRRERPSVEEAAETMSAGACFDL